MSALEASALVRDGHRHLAVFLFGLRLALTRRALVSVLATGVGTGLLLALPIASAPAKDRAYILWIELDSTFLRLLLPLFALLFASRAFSSEVHLGTFVYHQVRPVSRPLVYAWRTAAGILAAGTAGFVCLATLWLAQPVPLPPSVWGHTLVAALLVLTALSALYALLAALFRRGVLAGLIYTFVFEMMLGLMPGAIQKSALNHHARALLHGWVDGDFAAVSSRVRYTVDKGTQISRPEELGDIFFAPTAYDRPATAAAVLVAVAIVALLLGMLHTRSREEGAVPQSD